ncbi:MAG: trypsin-like serine protease [Clostridiales bacterium]|jgi:serine protease Do|nr:trypsin-like serine protease [Clostridiales bacterium]
MENYNTNNSQDNENSKYPKKKKKGFFLRALGLMAAALAFGLIAGATATGYHYFFQGGRDNKAGIIIDDDQSTSEEDNDESIIEISEDESDSAVYNSTEGIITDVSDVVEKVMPSIVSINSTDIITQYDIFFGRRYSTPVEGSGSGIIIGQNDTSILIVTNNHVVDSAQEIEAVFFDDSKVKATIKGADPRSDLAVIEVAIKDIPKETLSTIKVARIGDSDKLKAGEMVIAIGNALGYGQSVTVGYVSALNREITNQGITMNLIQTDAAINPGNSGGALINIHGEVVGINSLKFADTRVEGMGYAIPISDAIPMINLLMTNKVLDVAEMGFLGISVETAQNVTRDLANQFNMPVGIFINDIIENSPAEEAGLKSGHIIVAFNKMKVETIDDLVNMLTYSRPGEEIILSIRELQNGEYVEKDLNVILGERP